MERSHENVIEFLDSEKKAMLTLSKQRLITRVRKLKEAYPDDVLIKENMDGTIFAKVPVRWIKISAPRAVSDELKQAAAERFAEARAKRHTESDKL